MPTKDQTMIRDAAQKRRKITRQSDMLLRPLFPINFPVFGMKEVGVAERGCANDNMLVCLQLNIHLTIRKVKLNALNSFCLSWALHYNSIPAIMLPLDSHFIDCVFLHFKCHSASSPKCVCLCVPEAYDGIPSVVRPKGIVSRQIEGQKSNYYVDYQISNYLVDIYNIETMCHWNSMRPLLYWFDSLFFAFPYQFKYLILSYVIDYLWPTWYWPNGIGLSIWAISVSNAQAQTAEFRKKKLGETMKMSKNLRRERRSWRYVLFAFFRKLVSVFSLYVSFALFHILAFCCGICLSIRYICIQQIAMN